MRKRMLLIVSLLIIFCSIRVDAQSTKKVYLSGTGKDNTVNWQFYCTGGRNSGKWTTIPVPSNWELHGFGIYNYGHDWENSQKKVGHEKGKYKYTFSVPDSWKGKSVKIVFEGVMTDAKVKVNGQQAGPIHQGAFYTFKYDISDLIKYGSSNLLEVTVSKVSSNQSVNAAERRADYWIFGGIYRPVYLEAKPKQHIKRVAIRAKANGSFLAHVYTEGQGKATTVSGQIETLDGKKVGKAFNTNINHQAPYQTLLTKVEPIKPWSPEFPHLYDVIFYLKGPGGRTIHKVKKRIGFRTVELRKGKGIYVNGKKIRFKGVDYHSFWPSSGRTLSKALVIKDINLMKDMNMNAVRLSHYPRAPYFYDVADSLGIFVMDELAGWQASYDTDIGRKLVKEMVTADVNHPSIVMWNNGNEGGYNFDLDKYFDKWDPQDRPVNHPGSIYKDIDSQHYQSYLAKKGKLSHENKIYMPDEIEHALYDGGGGAGLADDWQLMRSYPRSAGGFIWAYVDECVERTDKGGRLDCAGNMAPDGIVGPYRRKEGSFYAIKEIWSPVQIKKDNISANWDERLWVGNRFFFTNLNQVQFEWKLIDYPGPFSKSQKSRTISRGEVLSPNIQPQASGFLQLDLPSGWQKADALQLKATGPHGRDIYKWTLVIKKPQDYVNKIIQDTTGTARIKQTGSEYILSSNCLTVKLSKKTGYITSIQKNGESYSLNGGPFLAGDSCSLKSINRDGRSVTATFSKDDYRVTYSLKGSWLKLDYGYRPRGKYSYFGISFNYPEKKVKGIKWLGHGPDRVWKNRLAGMELGLWHKKHQKHPDQVTIDGYHWHLPKFNGYYANLNWAVLYTDEGPITVMATTPGIYLGLLRPHFPPHPGHAKAKYPHGNLSFLKVISPIGSKFRKPTHFGPTSEPNLFTYGYSTKGHVFNYKSTLWFYFGKQK